ncbi:MAG: two-component system response regulator [Herbinix sp.]|jgi:YesN/AraC family two-component response regulator|nr:two-component system response regulator [Herbinix sp.]
MSEKIFSVVVVEDEKLIAKNIAKNIELVNENFKVISIESNGEDALSFIKQHTPNVIFTDIQMPVMDGIELVKQISEYSNYIKCVVLSGHDDFAYAKSSIEYGVFAYLLKPVNLEELSNILKRLEFSFLSTHEMFTSMQKLPSYRADEIASLLKKYIESNYQKPIDLNIIADHFSFSPSYLTKIFLKYMNITPSKYILNYRINIAKQLLGDFSLSINMVACMVGYTDPFHFSKSFKQVTGISPASYREVLNRSKKQ